MLNMSGTIRMRRRALGMTQEQLADRLGVSAPAVSKWEQGASYPDVTLLPALARGLGIDMNTLTGFVREPDKEQITQMLMRVNDTAKEQGIDAGFALAREMTQEYPTCGPLLFGLAATLDGCMMMTGMPAERRAPYAAQVRDWYVRAADSEDEETREAAAHLLASYAVSRGEIDEAQAMMQRLPREPKTARWSLEAGLLLAKGEKEQAAAYVQKQLFARAADIQQMLLQLIQMEIDTGELERAQALADLVSEFVKLLCLHPYVGYSAQLMPALARKDAKACVEHIRAMMNALLEPWTPGGCLPHDRPSTEQSAHLPKGILTSVLCELKEREEYAFLQEDEAFQALVEMFSDKS